MPNTRNPTSMNLLDRAIAVISPRWAYERLRYRAGINGYKAGAQSASRSNWTPIFGTGEQINKISRDVLRARAREGERDSDIINSILLAYRRNIVGNGFNLQARSSNKDFNKVAEKIWKNWCKAKNCDLTEQQSFREILNMIVQRYKVDGGILIIKNYTKNGKYPFKIQIREVDDLDALGQNRAKNGNIIASGVELDKNNKPTAYYLRTTDPEGFMDGKAVRIPAERVIFFWERRRPSEYREISPLARALPRVKDTDDFLDIVGLAHKIAASLALIITQKFPDGIAGGLGRRVQNALEKMGKPIPEDEKIQAFNAGDVLYLEPGQEPHNLVPNGMAAETKEFSTVQQRLAAAGQGVSHEAASRDVSEVNYSSARQNLLEDKKTYEDLQNSLIEHVIQPLYEEVIKAAYLVGAIDNRTFSDFYSNLEDYLDCDFLAQGMPWIDPLKEINAKRIAVENKLITRKELAASEGKDWEEMVDQLTLEKEIMDRLKPAPKKGEK